MYLPRLDANEFPEIVRELSYYNQSTGAREPELPYSHFYEHTLRRFSELKQVSKRVTDEVKSHGACLLTNLPFDVVSGAIAEKSSNVAETLILCVTQCLGKPLGYRGQRGGAVIHNITPTPGTDETAQSGTNHNYLEWHTEDAGLKYNCDHIALFCLRNDPRTATILARLDTLPLTPAVVQALSRPDFEIVADRKGNTGMEYPHPIITRCAGEIVFRVDPLFTRCSNQLALDSLNSLVTIADGLRVEIVLSPGDLLVFDNNRCIHGRRRIEYQDRSQLRWLQRAMIFSKEIPSSRVDFSTMQVLLPP